MLLNSSTGRRTDLGVAYYEDAHHCVVEDRAGEELRTFRSETHTTAGSE